jgi:DNA (cytosine-5)-methyltransferase 1
MKRLTHISTCTGIGGIDLAAEWAGFETVLQCEIADFPYQVLCKRWPNVPKARDIKDVTAGFIQSIGITDRITLLSGGFPCQPHSLAGKRQASSDERDLWPEYRRIIGEIRPKWFLAENVPGILSSENGRFFGGILRDLAGLGYHVGWGSFEAYTVGASFEGKRTFIIAAPDGIGWNGMGEIKEDRCSREHLQVFLPYAEQKKNRPYDLSFRMGRTFTNPRSAILRNDDGIPGALDRLKSLGNAVVPQQVYPILKMIAEIELNLL